MRGLCDAVESREIDNGLGHVRAFARLNAKPTRDIQVAFEGVALVSTQIPKIGAL